MDEFVFSAGTFWAETAEQIDHHAGDALADPDIAVDYPQDVPLRLSIGPAHVSNLGIRTKDVLPAFRDGHGWILILDKDFGIERRVVGYQAFEYRVGRVEAGRNAEVDREFGRRVALMERRGQTFVETRLEALDGTNDGDMRNTLKRQAG